MIVGPLIGQFLFSAIGYSNMLLVIGIIFLLIGLPIWFLLPTSLDDRTECHSSSIK